MHELSLTRNIVAIVADHAKTRLVRRVRLAVGPLACVEPGALQFCFELAAAGTVLDGARLEIVDGDGDALLIKDYELEEAA
jgi:hydrogenase nickel incorporation protein HypA/HybF